MREEVKRLKGGNLSKVALGVAAAGEVVNESEGGSGWERHAGREGRGEGVCFCERYLRPKVACRRGGDARHCSRAPAPE